MRAAIIKDGRVWNIIEADSLSHPEFTLVACDLTVQVGMRYDGATFGPDFPPLAEHKAARLAEAKAKRDEVEQAGFTYNGNVFDADMASVLRLVTAGFAVQGGPPGTQISWSAKDGAVVPLTPATLKEAAGALVSRADAVHARARALIAQINAAPDAAAVNAIDITSGWPV